MVKTATQAKPVGKTLMRWDERLAAEAAAAAEKEPEGGAGRKDWFSFQGGVMVYQDEEIPGDEIPVIILAHTFANVFYKNPFNPKKREAPVCWAFNEDIEDLAPDEEQVFDHQNPGGACEDCEQNKWKKCEDGKERKTCGNYRRLIVVPAGSFNEDTGKLVPLAVDEIAEQELAFVHLPITSGKFYRDYVKKLHESLKRPPWGIISKMYIKRDRHDQFHVLMEPMAKLTESYAEMVYELREKALGIIDTGYQQVREREDDDEDEKPSRGRAPAKAAPRRAAGGRKY